MDRKNISALVGCAATIFATVGVMTPQTGKAAEALPVDSAKIHKVVACILDADNGSALRIMAKHYDHNHPGEALIAFRTGDKEYLIGVSKNYPKETIYAGLSNTSIVNELPERGPAAVKLPALSIRQCRKEKEEVCTNFIDGGFRMPYYNGEPNFGWGIMDPNLKSNIDLLIKESRKVLDGVVDTVFDESYRAPMSYRSQFHPSLAEMHAQEDTEHANAIGRQCEYAAAIEDILRACGSNY